MLNVDIPLYAIRHKAIGGTEFAIYGLVKGLAAAGATVTVSYGRDDDLSPGFLAWLRQAPVRAQRRGGLPGPKNVRFAEELLFGRRATADWLLYPNYFAPPSRRRRCVVLHDIQYKVYPHFHSAKRRAWLDLYLPWMFRTVDRVALVSQSEADLVRRHFGDAAAAKCGVVPNAIDWARFDGTDLPAAVQARVGHRYILSVCHQFPHKNIGTLLRAFAEVAATDPDIRLYLIGSAAPEFRAGLPDRVELLGFVDDRSLGAYYAHAALFVLPSLYEGFGIPAAEAMGFGIPTLVSRAYALPEVTLGQAAYVDDPLDVGQWVRHIRALLGAPRLPPSLVEQVRARYAPAAVGNTLIELLGR